MRSLTGSLRIYHLEYRRATCARREACSCFMVMKGARSTPALGLLSAVVLAAWVLALAGCASATAPRHTVRIASAVDPAAKSGYAYVLAPDGPGRTDSDPFHAEVKARVRMALSQRGMYEAPSPASADIVVSFDYGEYPPQTQVTTVTEPVFVNSPMMGGVTDPMSRSSGMMGGRGSSVVMVESLRVTQTQEKYFRLEARENTAAKARVWSVDATVEDEGTPIAECIPAMVDAVIEYIGYRTPEPEKVVIRLGPDGPTR